MHIMDSIILLQHCLLIKGWLLGLGSLCLLLKADDVVRRQRQRRDARRDVQGRHHGHEVHACEQR